MENAVDGATAAVTLDGDVVSRARVAITALAPTILRVPAAEDALFGSDGGAEIKVRNYSWEDTLRIFTDVADVPAEISPRVVKGEGHLAIVRDFVAAVRGDDWAAHDGRAGLYRTQIIDACYASALRGREVVLSEAAVPGAEAAG
jgi:predicted dehydrogenase